jgi:ABC-type branched-subunit amino acid transport system ATPase component
MLEVKDVHAGYQRDIDVLQGVSVTAREGQLTTIIGANGVGKSTLLKTVMGQLRPHQGSIRYKGQDLIGLDPASMVEKGIAFIAQRHTVFPQLTVLENLEIGCWSFRKDKARLKAAIERAFERAPILQEFRGRPAGTMSGGQQRLLEIERALLVDPALVLVDEPTVGIDPKRAGQIYEHLRALVSEEKRTVLMVDQNVIAGIGVADYIYVLELGANRLEGSRAEFDANYRDTIADWLI